MCSKSFLLLLWNCVILMLVLPTFCNVPGESSFNSAKVRDTEPTDSVGVNDSCNDDIACLTMATQDRVGLEAIRSLHRQLDDDADGAIDLSESDDFLREELKYEKGAEKRQKAFHQNDDMYISVKDLWDAWVKSEVHNWTVEQTCDWLSTSVELPQYVPIFIKYRVTGAHLPRLAVTNMQFLNNVLGIKDPIHKQKIALKAMDVVLFGPPKDTVTHLKDLVLITLLLGTLIGFWYAYNQNKNSSQHLKRMMRDMESLQKAETALEDLQKELEKAKQEQEYVTTEKANLEKQLQEQQIKEENSLTLKSSYSDLEKIAQLKNEVEMLRNELARAEGELDDRCWTPPHGLQQWLQLTHEIENKSYIKKKLSAEKQLQQAREACEKLRKKRSSLVGAFVSTHGKSIDDVDRSIVEARTSLNEVTQELAERVHRWKQVETLCGFNIINNNGLSNLENVLYRNVSNGRNFSLRGRMSSQDDLEDDSSQYSVCVGPGTSYQDLGACENSRQWRDNGQDSSGSDQPECGDDEQIRSMDTKPCFILGEDICDVKQSQQTIQTFETLLKTHNPDTNQSTSEQVVAPDTFRHSISDSSLDPKHRKISKVTSCTDAGTVSPTPSEVSVKRIKRHKLFPIFLSTKSKTAKSYQSSDGSNLSNDKALKLSKQKS